MSAPEVNPAIKLVAVSNDGNGSLVHRQSAGTHQYSPRFRTLTTQRLDCALRVRSSKSHYRLKVIFLISQPPRNRVACPRTPCTNIILPPWTSQPTSNKMTWQMNNRGWSRPWEKLPLTKTISSSRASTLSYVNSNTKPSHQCHGSHRLREEHCERHQYFISSLLLKFI